MQNMNNATTVRKGMTSSQTSDIHFIFLDSYKGKPAGSAVCDVLARCDFCNAEQAVLGGGGVILRRRFHWFSEMDGEDDNELVGGRFRS